jgi:hypothetical protein
MLQVHLKKTYNNLSNIQFKITILCKSTGMRGGKKSYGFSLTDTKLKQLTSRKPMGAP